MKLSIFQLRRAHLERSFLRVQALERDIDYMTKEGITPSLMGAYNIVDPEADPNAQLDVEQLLTRMPANSEVTRQRLYVETALEIMRHTVTLVQAQMVLSAKPHAKNTKGIEGVIGRDGDVFLGIEKELYKILKQHKTFFEASSEHLIGQAELDAAISKPHNDYFAAISGHAKRSFERASEAKLLDIIFDSRLAIHDLTLEVFGLKAHGIVNKFARGMQWRVLPESDEKKVKGALAEDVKQDLIVAAKAYPKLQSDVHLMYGFLKRIHEMGSQTWRDASFKVDKYIPVSIDALPKITP